MRRDITEGKPGTSLRLDLTVVDASTCKPIRNAAVDIWHADASGVYSGFQQEGTAGLFFPEAVSTAVYERAPYATRGTQDTHNSTDGIYRNGGPKSMLS